MNEGWIKSARNRDKKAKGSGAEKLLSPAKAAPFKVKGEVVTQGELIYCTDEKFRVNFETYVRDMYFDFLPTLNHMKEVYLSSVKSGGLVGQT